jgi:hypothetical protein
VAGYFYEDYMMLGHSFKNRTGDRTGEVLGSWFIGWTTGLFGSAAGFLKIKIRTKYNNLLEKYIYFIDTCLTLTQTSNGPTG